MDRAALIDFLIRAKQKTYAGKGAEEAPSRPCSHDLKYAEGELCYLDTYLGGERFAGEEALWENGKPIWSMNYAGQVTGQPFSGDFLKEALLHVPKTMPYRGPERYENGDYLFTCTVQGDFDWFQGYETISFRGEKIYDCYFHGTSIRGGV